MNRIIILIAILLVVNSKKGWTQTNYVSNPSFEILDSCNLLDYADQFFLTPGWDTLRNGGGWGAVFAACSLAPYQTPWNGYGYEYPHSGNNYSLTCMWQDGTWPLLKAYIQNKLLDTLVAGKSYCVTFYISLIDRSKWAVDEVGAYLDDGSISTCHYCAAVANPQVVSPTHVYMTDTLNWMQVQGQFVANGTEQYLSIGNFRSYALTDTVMVPHHPASYLVGAGYYIDDVSVIESNSVVNAGADINITKGDTVTLGWQIVGMPVEWYSMQGILLAKSSLLTVHPDITTKYVVRMDLCGVVSYDTVQVTVHPVGIENIAANTTFSILPNPNNGSFDILTGAGNYEVIITDITGRSVYYKHFNEGLGYQHITTDLPKGLYICTITNIETGEKNIQKLVIQQE